MAVRVLVGDALVRLAELEAGSVDSVVTDPPYGLIFMGKTWDHGVPGEPYWREVLRVLKPGAHLVAFGGTRTYHRLTCAIEDAGFDIRDCLMWLYGCLSDDTEILVDGQWEPYHRATIGRLVLCYNATDDTYSWQPIQDTYRYDICDTAYRIQSDRTDQVVSRNHRCLVEQGGGYVFERAEEVARERTARVPVLEDLSGLLEALPVPHQGTGRAQSVVLQAVRRPARQWAASAQADVRTSRHGLGDLCRMREAGLEAPSLDKARDAADVLSAVQRAPTGRGVEATRTQRARCLDSRGQSELPREDERRAESCLEGRGDLQAEQGQLHRAEVRPLPSRVHGDGSERRLRHGASARRGETRWPSTDSDRIGASRRPQHQEQRPVQPDAVRDEPGPQVVRGARYASADLATVEPFHYDGVVWCVRVPTGAFVARRNGKVFVTGNSGFPKGKGCLKPGWEPIVLARKPGPSPWLNVDACRLATAENLNGGTYARTPTGGGSDRTMEGGPLRNGIGVFVQPTGRWPANVVLSHESSCREIGTKRVRASAGGAGGKFGSDAVYAQDPWTQKAERGDRPTYAGSDGMETISAFECVPECAVRLLDEQSGERAPGAHPIRRSGMGYSGGNGTASAARIETEAGGASRYFYCAKTSPAERRPYNDHPTVKPLALMQWLVRLVTPPGGVVLDPFSGSGSTLIAADREGFDAIGIDQDEHAVEIARRRLSEDAGMFAEVQG